MAEPHEQNGQGPRRRRPISKSLPIGLAAFSWISLIFLALVLCGFFWLLR
jgi:energy-converting hydrogenase Eha subunit E